MANALKAADIVPHKCGVLFSPPAVLYVYENKFTKKLRKLLMPVHNVTLDSDIDFLAEDLKMRHQPLLDSVELDVIKKMIFLIQQHKIGVKTHDALLKFGGNDKREVNNLKHELSTNLGKNCNDAELQKSDDDIGGDTDFDDLDVPIDKLGISSDEEGDKFWQ